MNTPMGFIGAMFEPCESKSQAIMTAFFMLVVAAGALAVAWVLYKFGEGARITMSELDISDNSYRTRRAESGVYQYMIMGYAGAAIAALVALVFILTAIIAPVRSLFPKERKQRDQVLR